MRVVSLAAGAAGMLCGSCIRDNRVAAVLRRMGRDILLVPTYTPLRSDEAVVAEAHVIFGGVNVYLSSRYRWARHLPRGMHDWLDSPAVLKLATRWSSRTQPAALGPLTLDVLAGASGPLKQEVARAADMLRELQPALVNLPNLMFLGLGRALRDALGVPIVVTLSGEDIFLDGLTQPWRDRANARIAELAGDVSAFLATSRYYADFAADRFNLRRERIAVVPLGVPVHDVQPPTAAAAPFTIGYLARVCPEKGLDRLVEALGELRAAGRDCRVLAAGYLGAADRTFLEQVHRRVCALGLHEHFEYRGEVSLEQKHGLLGSAHVFSVPTRYHEAKGLYVLEALAAGVPVVQPSHGSFPEMVEATGGGLLYDPEADGALAGGLARLMDDPALRERLSRAGRAAVRDNWSEHLMAQRTWEIYEQVAANPGGTTLMKARS